MNNKFLYLEDANCVLLTDISFWARNQDVLAEWCWEHYAEFNGMCVKFHKKADISLFALKF